MKVDHYHVALEFDDDELTLTWTPEQEHDSFGLFERTQVLLVEGETRYEFDVVGVPLRSALKKAGFLSDEHLKSLLSEIEEHNWPTRKKH